MNDDIGVVSFLLGMGMGIPSGILITLLFLFEYLSKLPRLRDRWSR